MYDIGGCNTLTGCWGIRLAYEHKRAHDRRRGLFCGVSIGLVGVSVRLVRVSVRLVGEGVAVEAGEVEAHAVLCREQVGAGFDEVVKF